MNKMGGIKKCVGKESFQRMNYLLQLSNHLITENPAAHIASVQYSNLTISISKKAVQRLDPEIKQTLCKGCRSLLIPGVTCKVRVKKNKLIKHCLRCHQKKIFQTYNSEYIPWIQNDKSLVELIDYTP